MNATPNELEIPNTATLVSSDRRVSVDQKFPLQSKITAPFQNYFFHRLVAKEVTFIGVDFRFTIFDTCYLRKCEFQNCNFTGCRFTGCNLYGSVFVGCIFDYTIFERTLIDSNVLDICCPGPENLKLKFARSLRANFQSLGDAAAVNKAIKVELAATLEHHFKGWKSKEAYYRDKYRGLSRIWMFFQWLGYKVGDNVWGNGESIAKLARAVAVVMVFMAVADVHFEHRSTLLLTSYFDALAHMPGVFFGLKSPGSYPELYLSSIIVVRLIAVGFLLSIIIKRFSRR